MICTLAVDVNDANMPEIVVEGTWGLHLTTCFFECKPYLLCSTSLAVSKYLYHCLHTMAGHTFVYHLHQLPAARLMVCPPLNGSFNFVLW